jgi:xylitol oxidase
MAESLSNWAANQRYGAARVHYPETVEDVQEIASRSTTLKALGTRHSFNDIADTRGDLVSLERLDEIVSIDSAARTVTVGAGVRYGRLCATLHAAGFALPNLASLPHISVAGACATATHGSGDANPVLAASVAALTMVAADGRIVNLARNRDGDAFLGAVVSLGALGIVTELTLDVVPTFSMRQDVYEGLTLSQLEANFDAVTASAYSVSLFTDWRQPGFSQVWLKRRVGAGDPVTVLPELFGAILATKRLHPLAGISSENCTEQMGVHGPWHERMPHFRMEFMPSSGEELQSEYLVPRRHALAAIAAIYRLRERISPILQISEIRTVAADDLWMSPCFGEACVAIHFTWQKEWDAVREVLPTIESALTPFEARPHWGKLFTTEPARLQALYRRLSGFRALAGHFDPEGKFRNAFLDTYVLGRR